MRGSRKSLVLFSCLVCFAGSCLKAASQPTTGSPRVGLALSGGGARGAAHIGVLKVLERERIPIHFIAGTSFGALVGGFYALGYPAAEIEEIFSSQDWDNLFSDTPERQLSPILQRKNLRYLGELGLRNFNIELPSAISGGQRLIEVLNYYTTQGMLAADYDFNHLKIPFRAVATDLLTGQPYIFDRGRMSEALRASIALPAIFTPVEKDDTLLVDGGLVNDLPTDIVRDMGADIVIAVDVTSPLLKKESIRTFIDVMDQALSLRMKQTVEANLKFADLVLSPKLEGFTPGDYTEVLAISAQGEAAAMALKNDLHELVRNVSRAESSESPVPPDRPVIESITFDNLTHVEASRLKSEVRARADQPVNVKVLREDLSRLYATGLFDQVDYQLEEVKSNRYRLHYIMKESLPHSIGASIRFDRDYKFVALGEFNARGLFGTPSVGTLSTQFGGLERHSAGLRLVHPRLSSLFLEPEVHFQKLERFDLRDGDLVDRFTDRRRGLQLMLGSTLFKRMELQAGYRLDRAIIVGGTSPQREEDSRSLSGLRARASRDTLDSQDFPRTGMLLNFQIDKVSENLGADFSYSLWQADLQRFFSLSERSAIRVYAGGALSRGALPFFERVYLGGYSFSEIGSKQFLGYSRDEFAPSRYGLAGAGYRRRLFSRPLSLVRRGYVYVDYNMAAISNNQQRPYDFKLYNGVGAGLLLDSLIGPVRLVGGWGESGRFNFYLSIGPAF
jgi:NTE family protein